ncbi:MAG: 16S rRNA (cytosine(967)-C(5))-methyltransferase RsmB [Clostridia bacterium]|nr:16S rRNA (cytosine(967)-C(5))-methyltransferase RsmB [Clostridia bacterium]MDR3645152.1 16S rRNA (cytosine(967)-C(5))-methyltransferase RsmB [Clostridia bacterium]
MVKSSRRSALEILNRIDAGGGYSNLLLDTELSKPGFNKSDKAFITALVYGVLENRLTADYVIARSSRLQLGKIEPRVLNLLRLGVCQILFMDGVEDYAAVSETVELAQGRHIKGFANGILRTVCREKEQGIPAWPDRETDEDGYLETRYSCPRRLIRKWRGEYGAAAAEGILRSLKEKPLHTARVNTLRTTRGALLSILDGMAQESALDDNAIEFERMPELNSLEAWKKGLFHLQGAASQLCCEALGAQPGETVLDLCAAPGGKSFTIAEMMQNRGRLLACELHESRLPLIVRGAERLGITILSTVCNDASLRNPALGMADRVLCDVPCSGLGVIRSKPEIRYRPLEESAALPALQYAILCEGAAHVRAGGTLVYSTCTLSRAENEEIASRFAGENAGFEPLRLPGRLHAPDYQATLLPHVFHTDGFFVAAFRKKTGD